MISEDPFLIYECTYEIQTPAQIQRQTMQAPRIMHERRFISLVEQAARAPSPIKIKVSRAEPYYDKYKGGWIEQEYSIVYSNFAYMDAYGENG